MFLRRSAFVKYFIAAFIGAALYCEWFIYRVQPVYWPELQCRDAGSCTKILFIADPQIQGDLAVPPPLNYLFEWDSDRYVKSTFSIAMQQLKPDILVYLGDLMDEGSISSIKQFHAYAKRLFNIFEVNYPVVSSYYIRVVEPLLDGFDVYMVMKSMLQVWLPGDNDIGGENEPIKKDKVAEFEKVFEQPSVITFQNISFYKVNGITNKFPKMEGKDNSSYKIVVSHYPVTMRHVFGHQINNEIHPNIYFCAHEHDSKYIKQDRDLSHRETHLMTGSQVLTVPPNEETLYEVYVPTCSYRMGTNKIGYGAAVIENNSQELRYAVLWSPQRFPYLFFYLALLTFVIIYSLVFCAARLFHRQPKGFARSSDKVPLL